MTRTKIKKGDNVIVITGKDRGKTGKVLRVIPLKHRIAVEGIALQTRHRRSRKAREKGQKISVPGMISTSNIKLICSSCGKPTRVGFQIAEDGKHRLCKKCKAILP